MKKDGSIFWIGHTHGDEYDTDSNGRCLQAYKIRAMFSKDGGKTWDTDNDIYINGVDRDMGYPSTVELKDGSLLTVFYAHETEDKPATIIQQKWDFERVI